MSVYGTIWSADEDHADDCGAWVQHEYHRELGDGPCTCGLRNAPIVYQGSHILPSETDRRGGHVSLALIPGFITRDGRDDGPDDENGSWPWLRLSVGQDDAVLDEPLAASLHTALGEWLRARRALVADPGQPDPGSATIRS